MKFLIVLAALAAVVYSRPEETYDSRYDNFDANELVGNTRLLTAYGNCFLGAGPCTPEGTEFKKTIPEALKTSCAKCSAKQRDLVRIVVIGFQTKTPKIWSELTAKQDPKGEYKESFEKFINGSD